MWYEHACMYIMPKECEYTPICFMQLWESNASQLTCLPFLSLSGVRFGAPGQGVALKNVLHTTHVHTHRAAHALGVFLLNRFITWFFTIVSALQLSVKKKKKASILVLLPLLLQTLRRSFRSEWPWPRPPTSLWFASSPSSIWHDVWPVPLRLALLCRTPWMFQQILQTSDDCAGERTHTYYICHARTSTCTGHGMPKEFRNTHIFDGGDRCWGSMFNNN